MKISIVGSGRVGMVVAACFARLGNEVTVVDIDDEIVEAVNRGVSPIHEPGLDEIMCKANIKATSDYSEIIDSGVIFICVNTPSGEDGSISIEYIKAATEQIASILKKKQDYF